MGVGTSLRGAAPKVRYRLPAAVRSAATRFRRPEALSPSQFRRRIEAQMPVQADEVPLADQLLRNDRTRALVRSRLDRLTPEQRMRSLPGIAQGYQDFLASKRAEEIARQRQMSQAASDYAPELAAGAAAAGLGAMLAAELAGRPGAATPIEPEVYLDEEDVDTDGLGEMILAAMDTPVVPDIAMLLDESASFLDDGADLGDIGFQGDPKSDLGRGLELADLVLERDQTPDRDPYMTDAQKRTVRALMNAGIPSQRAGMIARGEASLTMEEYRNLTGGRR